MKHLLPAFFVLLTSVFCARGQVPFAPTPTFSFTDNVTQKIVSNNVVQSGTMSITAKASTTGIDMSANALTTDTPIEVTAGNFSYIGTLGDDPNYTPGTSTSISVPMISPSTSDQVGTLAISWTATTITFTVLATSPDDFNVGSENYLGTTGPFTDTTVCDLQFSDHRLDSRTGYISGTGSEQVVFTGPQGNQTENDLFTEKITGQIDSVLPVCKITSLPAPGTVYKQIISISGSASDNRMLADVQVQVNSGSYVSVGGSNNWTLTGVHVLVGTNTVNAIAIDQDGNQSAVATTTFHYSATSPLKISVAGPGKIKGEVTGTTTQPTGKRITLHALPKSGYIFDKWTGTFPSNSARLTFNMTPFATLQAHFVANPFIRVRGNYSGLVTTSGSNAYGSFGATLSPFGVFTARLPYNGATYRLLGRFGTNGLYSGTITLPDTTTLDVQLQLDTSGDITGTITDASSNVFYIASNRAGYVPKDGGTALAGSYTFLIMPNADDTSTPRGIGFGNLNLAKTGVGRWAGVMGDGTPFTASANLAQDNTMPLFIPMYAARGLADQGFVGGLVTFRNIDLTSDFDATLDWMKPDRPNDTLYPTAFATQVPLIGSAYHPEDAAAALQSLDSAEMDLADGDVGAGVEVVTYQAPNRFTYGGGDVVNLGAVTTFKNGRISGNFLVDGATNATPFAGVLFQKQDIIGGLFPGTAQTGSFHIYIPGP